MVLNLAKLFLETRKAGVSNSFLLSANQHCSCNCMVALKGPVVTELTAIIYATLMLK